MPEIVTVQVPVRGHIVPVEVVQDEGDRPSVGNAIAIHLEMLTLALAALEDPRVDAVLAAFGFEILVGENTRIVFKPIDSTDVTK